MTADHVLPPAWADRIRAWYAGELTPVEPRPAATVLLLRDEVPGPQVYLLRRRTSMAFAAGMYAYPGGAVDPRDADHAVGWAGPAPEVWARRFGTDVASARAIVCAAVRETFEEAGVLLAGPDATTVVGDVTGQDWEDDRVRLVDRRLAFADFLTRRGLVLRSDLLAAWTRWITPEFEARRYDTWFFVAALPADQRTRDVSGEADQVIWIDPAEALNRHTAGEMAMLPPTSATLGEISGYGSVAEVLAAAAQRDLAPVQPTAVVLEGGRIRFLRPGDPGYPGSPPPAARPETEGADHDPAR